VAFLGVSLLLCSGSALGDESSTTRSQRQTEPVAKQAAAAYTESLSQYAAGDLQPALESMRESYRLSQRFELLYNIARLESELGDCSASLADYRSYLELVPEGRYREDAERASGELMTRCGAKPVTVAPPESPSPVLATSVTDRPATRAIDLPKHDSNVSMARPYWTPMRWLGWSMAAAGTLAGAGAVYFELAAADARDRFRESVNRQVAGGDFANLGLRDSQHRNEHRAQALAVSGGLLLASGLVVVILAPPASARSPRVSLDVQIGSLGASFSSRF
jgi:hypothetical protein